MKGQAPLISRNSGCAWQARMFTCDGWQRSCWSRARPCFSFQARLRPHGPARRIAASAITAGAEIPTVPARQVAPCTSAAFVAAVAASPAACPITGAGAILARAAGAIDSL